MGKRRLPPAAEARHDEKVKKIVAQRNPRRKAAVLGGEGPTGDGRRNVSRESEPRRSKLQEALQQLSFDDRDVYQR